MSTRVIYRSAARTLQHRSGGGFPAASTGSAGTRSFSAALRIPLIAGIRTHVSLGPRASGALSPIAVGGEVGHIAIASTCRRLSPIEVMAAARRYASSDGVGKADIDVAAAAAAAAAAARERAAHRETRRKAYEKYRERNTLGIGLFSFLQRSKKGGRSGGAGDTVYDRNVKMASYAAAVVIGALGATYASVPLYKMFCQATGFGGTTQRVTLKEWAAKQEEREDAGTIGSRTGKISQALWEKLTDASNIPSEMLPKRGQAHGRGGAKTWTDEDAAARLASLKPVVGGRLITVRFDSTVGDVMPWSFTPTQLDVKVVPGETALSFFTATNHSKEHAITGVATYNVHPPRAGLYFNKIQCFCFEEQRLLPGETIDMPVFFFIDPEYADDPQLARCNNITLSYTFFQTDEDDDEEDDEEEEEEEKEDVDAKNAGQKDNQGGGVAKRGWVKRWLGRQ